MNRIKELRQQHGWLQKDLEQKMNLGRGNISRYETEAIDLSPQLIGHLCDIFGVSADYLLCRSDTPEPAVSEEDAMLLRAYHAAPDHIRTAILAMLQLGSEKENPAAPEPRAAG